MSKNIILLSDGTGNSNIKDRGTNVFKLYEAIDFNRLHDPQIEQVAFYDDGVGTEELKPLKILGGAFGWGLARNVRNLYERLVQVYEPGDKIYLFGFSRGAFTVRTLAGLITCKGILKADNYRNNDDLRTAVLQLYEGYRAENKALLEGLYYVPIMNLFYKAYRKEDFIFHGEESQRIEFIGVWDTVDAVGMPFDGLTDAWNTVIFRFKFREYKLNPNVKRACHALSLDDERQSFHPRLWNESGEDPKSKRIEQVWFPGVHANVGGGYPQQGLSLVALEWMIKRAKAAGLQFIPNVEEFVHDQKYACDKLYDSRSGLGVYYRYEPRNIAKLCLDNNITVPQIHVSAFERIASGILGYAPGNLPAKFEVVDDGIVDPKSLTLNATDYPESSKILEIISPQPSTTLSSLLLQKVNGYIHLRHGIYYIFLVYSFFTLYRLVLDDIKCKSFWEGLVAAIKALACPDTLLEKLGSLLSSNIWLTIIGIVIFFAAYLVRRQMEKSFSAFWAPLRHRIKEHVQ